AQAAASQTNRQLARSGGSAVGELWLAPLAQVSAQAGGAQSPGQVSAVITSLGTSQGEAFDLQIVNDSPQPVRVSGAGIVVEPLKRAARNEAQKALEKLGTKLRNATTVRAEGYCLDIGLEPPDAGTLYRIAPQEIQQKFAPVRNVLQAAAKLGGAGGL